MESSLVLRLILSVALSWLGLLVSLLVVRAQGVREELYPMLLHLPLLSLLCDRRHPPPGIRTHAKPEHVGLLRVVRLSGLLPDANPGGRPHRNDRADQVGDCVRVKDTSSRVSLTPLMIATTGLIHAAAWSSAHHRPCLRAAQTLRDR